MTYHYSAPLLQALVCSSPLTVLQYHTRMQMMKMMKDLARAY